ncbi:MAG TPA: DUF3325 family protein [Croceibacterium sp.]
MSDGILLAFAQVLAIGGMGCLALSLAAHWKQVFGDRAQTRGAARGLRTAGALLLAASFGLCATANPVSMAALVWPMMLTLAAAIVAAALTARAQRARRG